MRLIEEFIDASTPEAWAGCLRWSIGRPEILDAFQRDTGLVFQPARNALEALIDQASGRDEALVRQYLAWFNEHVWGPH